MDNHIFRDCNPGTRFQSRDSVLRNSNQRILVCIVVDCEYCDLCVVTMIIHVWQDRFRGDIRGLRPSKSASANEHTNE